MTTVHCFFARVQKGKNIRSLRIRLLEISNGMVEGAGRDPQNPSVPAANERSSKHAVQMLRLQGNAREAV